jgi:hypothetical protein
VGTGIGLAWAGVRHRPGPWLLLALGLALAAVMPLAAAGLQERATVGAVQQAVVAVPEPARGVLAVTSRDLRGPDLASLSDQVSSGLERAGLPTPTRALAFRSLSLQGTDATVAALDRLPVHVSLTSGRLPTTCSPTACEVLVVGAGGGTDGSGPEAAGPDLTAPARRLGLVVTGTATLREPRLVGLGLVAPGQPLLIGSDPAAMADLAALTLYGRNLAWFSPLDAAVVTTRGASGFSAALDQIAGDANLVAGPLNVTWPDSAVLDAAARAQGSAGRFAVLGVGAGALQLGFCLVLAAARRPAQRQQGTLLGRRGARPGQVLGVATLQAAFAVVVGLLVGTAAGLAAVVALTRGLVPDPWFGARLALGSAWPVVLGLGAAALLGSVLLAAGRGLRPRTLRAVLGAAVLLAAALATLALVRPTPDPRAPLPVAALVGLTLGAGLVGALLWSPAVAALGRLGRGPATPLRGTVLLAARRPLLPSVTAGFLAAALATAFLAGAWSASTQRSAQDQAASLVPLDASVAPSTQVLLPSTVVDPARLSAVAPDVVVAPVTSTVVSVFAGSGGATALPLTGLDPNVLPLVHRWSAVTGSSTSAERVADLLRTPTTPTPAPVVPAGTRRLVLDVRGLDADVTLGVWVAGPDGQERQVRLTQRGDEAYADLGAGPALAVRALEIGESADHITHRQHGIGEGSTDRQLPSGTLLLGAVHADGALVPWSWTGWGADAGTVGPTGPDGAGLRARYRISDARAVLLPSWVPVAQRPVIPVAVDAVTAARAGARGTFGVTLNSTTQPVRVVAVLPRMPTLPSRFVLADRTAVSALVDRTAPGTGPVAQVWVGSSVASQPAVRAELTASASAATVRYRDDLARGFAADPVTTGFVALLAAAGLVAFLLGLVAVVGGVRGDRDQAGADLFALEVDGVGPAALRRVLLARAALVVGVGLPVGLLAGAGLAAAATRLLGTGPDGRPLTPPPHVVLASAPTALVLVAAVVGTLVAAASTASASLREPVLAAPELELR